MSIHVLYDGWDLAYAPHSPAALNLLAILAYLPEDVLASVAIPGPLAFALPGNSALHLHETANASRGLLRWQQSRLPQVFSKLNADLLHLTTAHASLFSNPTTIVSPTGYGQSGRAGGMTTRLSEALGKGGMSKIQAIVWPEDLPSPRSAPAIYPLPAIVHPDFRPYQHAHPPEIPELQLPETYLLYHGPQDERTLAMLLECWSWAAGPIGEYYPLYLIGLKPAAQKYVTGIMPDESVRFLPEIAPPVLAKVYQGSSALYHLGPISPWGGPIRHTLACARPVVALETPHTDALVGAAAFLVPEGDARAFASAMISVVVNPEVYEPLMAAAHKRSEAWRATDWGERLVRVYKETLGN